MEARKKYHGQILVGDIIVHSDPGGVVLTHINRRPWRCTFNAQLTVRFIASNIGNIRTINEST